MLSKTAGIDRETGEDRSGSAQANRALGHHIQDSVGYGNPMRGCGALVRVTRSGDSASTFEEGKVLLAPVPIPNTEVKLPSADGTAWEAVWESRTLPARR